MASMRTIVWLTRSTPPLVQGWIGALGNFVDTEALVERAGEFGADLKVIIGKKRNRASPERDVAVE